MTAVIEKPPIEAADETENEAAGLLAFRQAINGRQKIIARPPVDDAKVLTDFVADLRVIGQKTRNDISDSERRELAESAGLLESIDRLIEIVRDYETISLGIPRSVGPFIPGGLADLTALLVASFSIGGLVPKDSILAERFKKLQQDSMRKAQSKRHPGSDAINERLALMYARSDKTIGQIADELGMTEKNAQKRIDRMIAKGELQKRSKKKRPKK
jgi:hypothetical protein